MRVCVVEDDQLKANQLRDWCKGRGWACRVYSSVYDARNAQADLFVIDISAVFGELDPHQAVGPILTLASERPGALFAISSGITQYFADQVLEELWEHLPREQVFFAGNTVLELEQRLTDYGL